MKYIEEHFEKSTAEENLKYFNTSLVRLPAVIAHFCKPGLAVCDNEKKGLQFVRSSISFSSSQRCQGKVKLLQWFQVLSAACGRVDNEFWQIY